MKKLFYVGLIVVVCASSFALPDTIEVEQFGIDAGGIADRRLGSDARAMGAGLRVLDTRNPNGPLANLLNDRIGVFCCELLASRGDSFVTYEVASLADAIAPGKAALIAQLWELHYDDAWLSNTSFGQSVDMDTDAGAVAFSLCIHGIIYDYDGTIASLDLYSGVGDGIFEALPQTDPFEAIAIAQGWLDNLSLNYQGPQARLVLLSNSEYQDFITEIPEPATMLLQGLSGLILWKRK